MRLVCCTICLINARFVVADGGRTAPMSLADARDADAALALVKAGQVDVTQASVLVALEHGWWGAATAILRSMRERGEPVGSMQEVRATATRIRDQATDVINLLRVGANAEETSVACAFQWAQRPEFIYLNVKFSSRIDGPVTVLNVDNENVTLTNESMDFSAVGRQKPKKFRLNLLFNKEIDPELSQWSFASVGRISFTLAKKVHETWPRLLRDKKKPKNMHHWYERQVTLDAEVKEEAKKRKEAKEKADKDAAEVRSKKAADEPPSTTGEPRAPGSPPMAVASDGESNEAMPPASPLPPKKKGGKKKGKGKGKGGRAAKDEL
uniref:CS domain-containing protein n=1 Tax=Coccolithus braarudii TaxID=221442 RepID=A0A7S0LNH0_9EUKA|mmetsp:Transcript_4533/g.9803  ORF Transcript_4533/g.9803 Transcript_4533/m.9803 type:complete len:324 (+) Transcript_4533:58-1029(+)